jgi:transposase-like protein
MGSHQEGPGGSNLASSSGESANLRSLLETKRRRSGSRGGDKWHLDEVVISFAGKKHWLWRAVDQDGFVLDVLVQSRRDTEAAKRLFRKLLKKQGRAPRVLITDKLKSYAAAKREIMPGVELLRRRKSLVLQETSEKAGTRVSASCCAAGSVPWIGTTPTEGRYSGNSRTGELARSNP